MPMKPRSVYKGSHTWTRATKCCRADYLWCITETVLPLLLFMEAVIFRKQEASGDEWTPVAKYQCHRMEFDLYLQIHSQTEDSVDCDFIVT